MSACQVLQVEIQLSEETLDETDLKHSQVLAKNKVVESEYLNKRYHQLYTQIVALCQKYELPYNTYKAQWCEFAMHVKKVK